MLTKLHFHSKAKKQHRPSTTPLLPLYYPLNNDNRCLIYNDRPIRCRIHGLPGGSVDLPLINDTLENISRNIFFSLSGFFLDEGELSFSLADTVSGKFVQEYFYCLVNKEKAKKR